MKDASRSDNVSALERGVAVLRCFSNVERQLTNSQISERTGIPKPTVTRLASTLVNLGLMQQDKNTEAFELSAGVVSIAQSFLSGLDVRAKARPHMQSLAEVTGGVVYLAVRDGLEMVLIEISKSRLAMLSSNLDVGSRVPLTNSSLGRAYLAGLEEGERRNLIETLHLSRGSEWSRLAPGLDAELKNAKKLGFTGSYGEWHKEISSVAIPIRGPNGELMSINCGGSAYKFTPECLQAEVSHALASYAQKIADEIGGMLPLIKETDK
jgi:DNA-binding IclR family transcriptional regulator